MPDTVDGQPPLPTPGMKVGSSAASTSPERLKRQPSLRSPLADLGSTRERIEDGKERPVGQLMPLLALELGLDRVRLHQPSVSY